MKISLIICAYNEENYIKTCLEKAMENSSRKLHEIIVVDNNSTDRTKEIAEKIPGVKVVQEIQKGANFARQKGFEVSSGDILAFIDADNHIPKNWINILIKEFENNSELVCLSGPYIYYDFSKSKQFLSLLFWYFAYPVYLFVGYMAMNGNLVIKKETLKKIGGFDTTIFYGDDTNIARRASKHGKVKFKLGFVVYSSARRMHGQGMAKTTFIYILNFFSQVFTKKSVTKSYKDIR
ncbi:MAG: glycosyltransferase family A protein [Candidatus Pacebacteria bacterium]|nr:glycosyltransferase family A protein [Candidatus Paceibacterota bacterium]